MWLRAEWGAVPLLVEALIAFGAITGMGYLATGLNHAFSNIATILTTNVT